MHGALRLSCNLRAMRRILIAVLLAACGEDLGPLDVEVETGVVRGGDDGDGVKSWLGIPYAAPPTGPLRWKPPAKPLAWDGTRDGTKLGQKCPQNTVITSGGGIEDCLSLNVWAPTDAKDLPVMVWIHGGAFVFGSGGDPFYSGAELARSGGVVVVTINYRLGGLGFLAHPALSAENGSSGNYGLLDQIAALEWVQRNIDRFGGDPKHVTVFGESAGGFSICTLLVSKASANLFERAIIESGACSSAGLEQTRADAEANGIALAEKLGCPGTDAAALACMRDQIDYAILDATALPPIMQQPPGGFFYANVPPNTLPNIDGIVLPASIEQRFAAADFPARTVILGTNRDEGTLFHSSILANLVMTEDEYRAALERRFGAAKVDAIVAQYPVASFPTANAALAEISGDAFFVCPARRNARALAKAGSTVYRYVFARELEQQIIADLGVFHSSEIPFVFGNDAFPLGRIGSGAPLSQQMQALWTGFAKGEAIDWPVYDPTSDPYLLLDTPIAKPAGYKTAVCDFWDGI
jgi:para-nitrobenzyl esterase